MTDFLTNLAARVIAPEGVVKPRLAPLFAPWQMMAEDPIAEGPGGERPVAEGPAREGQLELIVREQPGGDGDGEHAVDFPAPREIRVAVADETDATPPPPSPRLASPPPSPPPGQDVPAPRDDAGARNSLPSFAVNTDPLPVRFDVEAKPQTEQKPPVLGVRTAQPRTTELPTADPIQHRQVTRIPPRPAGRPPLQVTATNPVELASPDDPVRPLGDKRPADFVSHHPALSVRASRISAATTVESGAARRSSLTPPERTFEHRVFLERPILGEMVRPAAPMPVTAAAPAEPASPDDPVRRLGDKRPADFVSHRPALSIRASRVSAATAAKSEAARRSSPLPPAPEVVPDVHVTIGRVEVRAVAVARPETPVRARRPAMSLDEYLSRRGGRRE